MKIRARIFYFLSLLILQASLNAFSLEQEIVSLNVSYFKDSKMILTPKLELRNHTDFNLANIDGSTRFAKYYHLKEMHCRIKGKSLSFKERLAHNGISIIKNHDQGTVTVKKIMGESWRVFVEGSKDVLDRTNVYNAQGGIEVHW